MENETYEVYDIDNGLTLAKGLSYESALAYSLALDTSGFNTDFRQGPECTEEYILLI